MEKASGTLSEQREITGITNNCRPGVIKPSKDELFIAESTIRDANYGGFKQKRTNKIFFFFLFSCEFFMMRGRFSLTAFGMISATYFKF